MFFSTSSACSLAWRGCRPTGCWPKLAAGYVEVLRNVPLVVQLFFWYAVITESLPAPAEALNPLPGVFLSNRGLALPIHRRSCCHSQLDYPALYAVSIFPAAWLLSPEFAALFLGLALYTAAFIGEIVRAGILAVDRGQYEAAYSLGLEPAASHALDHLAPGAACHRAAAVTSQYLNCTKNSSLAVAIGYPDLVSIANTTINQTGQAIEGIADHHARLSDHQPGDLRLHELVQPAHRAARGQA